MDFAMEYGTDFENESEMDFMKLGGNGLFEGVWKWTNMSEG